MIPSVRARGFSRAIFCGFLAAALFIPANPARACSVCIAHALGAAMHGLGAQTLPHNHLIAGLSFVTFDKSNAGEDKGTTEHETFRQYSLDLNYGLNDRMTLRATVPFVDKDIALTGQPAENAHGLGDIILGTTYQLPPDVKSHLLTAFTFDLKLPSGANNDRDELGGLKEQHLQVGTGSTDFIGGVQFSLEGKRPGQMWIGSLRGRANGSNSRHFQYGNVIFYDVGYVQPVGREGAAVLEFNGRIAEKDRNEDGSRDPNSGGHLGYLSLSYRHEIKGGFGLIGTVQVPVWKQLNGTQDEKTLFSVSLTKSL
jgi:hypothetical protein